ncbi:YdbL family protein [candidate division KSB1 bacterium]|nr:YdbL family protein [candidate division KSB1 bacterium]
MKKYNLILLGCWLLAGVACSVKTPEVTVTGEKTALENQVIGTYEKIEEETWLVASVRASADRKEAKISDEKKRVLDAVQNRKFNKDEINEYKRDGSIGENNRSFLELRACEKLDQDPEYKKRVLEIIQEENRDREIIMNRVIEVNEDAAKASKEEVYTVFATMNRENAETGQWVQLPDGNWTKKVKPGK